MFFSRNKSSQAVLGSDNAARGELSQRQGAWGEEIAARFMRESGFSIIGRNQRPSLKNRHYEIDLICRQGDLIVFVEVKTRSEETEWQPALLGITRDKKRCLLYACKAWLWSSKWTGSYRFDVIEIRGRFDSGSAPKIEHYPNVPLFVKRSRKYYHG